MIQDRGNAMHWDAWQQLSSICALPPLLPSSTPNGPGTILQGQCHQQHQHGLLQHRMPAFIFITPRQTTHNKRTTNQTRTKLRGITPGLAKQSPISLHGALARTAVTATRRLLRRWVAALGGNRCSLSSQAHSFRAHAPPCPLTVKAPCLETCGDLWCRDVIIPSGVIIDDRFKITRNGRAIFKG